MFQCKFESTIKILIRGRHSALGLENVKSNYIPFLKFYLFLMYRLFYPSFSFAILSTSINIFFCFGDIILENQNFSKIKRLTLTKRI